MHEVRAKLASPRPRPEALRTLRELLDRIRESPDYPAAAAQALCQALGDAKSYTGFKARCDVVYLGELYVPRSSHQRSSMRWDRR